MSHCHIFYAFLFLSLLHFMFTISRGCKITILNNYSVGTQTLRT